MAQEERYFSRDRAYSAWHRRNSISRFGISREEASEYSMMDMDSVWFDKPSRLPISFFEMARDVGQFKPATVTRNIGRLAGAPAYLVLYTLSNRPNPADESQQDIDLFKVRRLYPPPVRKGWMHLTPVEFAMWEQRFRARAAERILSGIPLII